MTTFFVKAEGVYDKGTILDELWLESSSVKKAMEKGLKNGQRVTVKVKVGKRRKLVKAYFTAEYVRCCDDHNEFMGYRMFR